MASTRVLAADANSDSVDAVLGIVLIKSSLAELDIMKGRPSAAKATSMVGSNGMAEAMPCPKPIYETRSRSGDSCAN
jgi:hypothetical protein